MEQVSSRRLLRRRRRRASLRRPGAGTVAQSGFARTSMGRQLGLELERTEALGELLRTRATAARADHASVHEAAGATGGSTARSTVRSTASVDATKTRWD